MRPCFGFGTPRDQRPVDLARRALAECARQLRGGKTGLGHQQAARGLLVDPVHQSRFLPLGVAHHLQHVIDVARDARATLHRKPDRLVQHQHIGVLEQRHFLQRRKRLLRCFRQRPAHLRRIQLERRDAYALAFFEAVLAVSALAVHTQLAFADDALDMGKGQAGKARFEETIDAHVGFVSRHDHGLHFRGKLDFGRGLCRFFAGGCRLLAPRLGKARRLAGTQALQPVALGRIAMRPRAAAAGFGAVAFRPIVLIARLFTRSAVAAAHASTPVELLPSAKGANRHAIRHAEVSTNSPCDRPFWAKRTRNEECRK